MSNVDQLIEKARMVIDHRGMTVSKTAMELAQGVIDYAAECDHFKQTMKDRVSRQLHEAAIAEQQGQLALARRRAADLECVVMHLMSNGETVEYDDLTVEQKSLFTALVEQARRIVINRTIKT